MTADDKVTPLPTLLERLGRRIDQAWKRTRQGESEWIDGSLELAQALAEGRGRFPSNEDFGKWLEDNKHDHVNKNDRAALLGLAGDIELARKVLGETNRRSYQLIWIEVQGRFPSARNTDKTKRKADKTKRARRQKKPGVKQAQRAVDTSPEVWENFKTKALEEGYPSAAAKLGEMIAERDTRLAKERETGQREVLADLDAVAAKNFTEKGKIKIDDAIRVHKARLDKQFEQRVNAEVRRRIDAADDATRANNKRLNLEIVSLRQTLNQRAVFTLGQFNLLRRALHPDRIQRFGDAEMVEEFKAAAQLLTEKKKKLVPTENGQ